MRLIIRDNCSCLIPVMVRRHFIKAKEITLPTAVRILHGLVGFLESIPLIGIIICLIQVIVVKIYKFLIKKFLDLEIQLLKKRLTGTFLEPRVEFPKKFIVDLTLFNKGPFNQIPSYVLRDIKLSIVNEYSDLPWPKDIKEVLILGASGSGLGDVFYINKIENFFSRRISNFKTKFLFLSQAKKKFRNRDYLSSKIDILKNKNIAPNYNPDIIVLFLYKGNYRIPRVLNEKMKGRPVVSFYETSSKGGFDYSFVRASEQLESLTKDYLSLHSFLFTRETMIDALCLGLTRTGLFIDSERASVPLSKESYCLSFLPEIKDESLKEILFQEIKKSGEGNISMNYGYSHYCSSKLNFLDCVALHEKEKDVCVVLTESQNYKDLNAHLNKKNAFLSVIRERQGFLRECGFSDYCVKSCSGEVLFSSREEGLDQGRTFTVILTSGLAHEDVLNLQLASERLLCTGDMSFTESVEARCKMLCYERLNDFASMKVSFSEEVQRVASGISLGLSDFMGIFSSKDGDQLFTEEELEKVKEILRKGSFSQDTVNFCKLVKEKYSFEPVLEGLIKRKLWLEKFPELEKVEAEVLGEKWKKAITFKLKKILSKDGVIEKPDKGDLEEVVEIDVSSLKEKLLGFIKDHR